MAGKSTYQQAGVDTRKAAALVGDIGTHVRRTQQTRKLWGAFGLFAACYDLSSYKEPVMMTGCDGVGTKLELLLEHDLLETAGKDLVAMSVNDILTTGGDPLLFLDYIGIAALHEEKITRLISGMADYLEACDCILAGGESAEMPGLVPDAAIELSGFCIGAATTTRDYFITDIPFDAYNSSGVTISRGPNSLLFGIGNPAGVIEGSIIHPQLSRNRTEIGTRYGSMDSYRGTVDINRVLMQMREMRSQIQGPSAQDLAPGQVNFASVLDAAQRVGAERAGRPGWWVPDPVMTDLLQRLDECQRAKGDAL